MTAISRLPCIANDFGFTSRVLFRLESTRTSFGKSSQLSLYQSRPFATKNSKTSRTNKNASGNEPKNGGQSALGGKRKRAELSWGLSYLYRHGGPLSPGGRHGPSVSPDYMMLKEALDGIVDLSRKLLPARMTRVFEEYRQDMMRNGLSAELKPIIEKHKNGRRIDIATMLKMMKIVNNRTRVHFERQIKDELARRKKEMGSPNAKEPGQSGQRDFKASNQDSDKKKNSEGGSGDFNVSEMKLDAGTLITGGIGAYLLYRMIVPSENRKEISWQEFRTTFFDKGLVDKLTVINQNRVRVDLHREATGQMYPDSPAQHNNFYYYFTIGSVEAFERRLDDAQDELEIPNSERIPVTYTTAVSWLSTLMSVGPTLLLIGGLSWLSRRATRGGVGGGGVFGMGKSRAKRFNHESDVQIKFKDVAGMDEAKAEIMEFVSFLKEPGQYQRLGAKIPRGAILSGPPGTGKTLLAKATAGESRVPFFSVSGSEFVEMFVGVGPSRVRDLFANARKNTPCIIFIDEIDAIGKARGKGNFGSGNDERESTLNQILTEMDGFNTSEQVVVLAGTNRPDVLDKALLRPGRFDRHIAIDRPTMEGRKQIFVVHLGKIVTNDDIDHLSGRLAALTPGFSGADIANCVNEAALVAARTNAQHVVMTHFEQAIERVVGGLEKKSLVLNPEEKRTVAYHEAGHAICGWFFKHADPLLKVSIIPRGQGALGYAMSLPQSEIYLLSQNHLMDRMAMTLGGRVSEELHFETVTSGATDDFKKVTRMATAMVTQFGMSDKLGHVYFEDGEQRLHKPFAEETARDIDLEVRRIVREAYDKCRSLLVAKKKELGLVAEELLRLEVLGRDDLIRLLGKRPFEDNKEFAKYFDGTGGKSAPPPPPTESESNGFPIPTPI